MFRIKKRDGSIVDFDLKKIERAIEKAFIAEHKEFTQEIIELLALKTTANFNSKIKDNIVSVEEIQDAVNT